MGVLYIFSQLRILLGRITEIGEIFGNDILPLVKNSSYFYDKAESDWCLNAHYRVQFAVIWITEGWVGGTDCNSIKCTFVTTLSIRNS